jgi:hypothetical protein
MQVFALLIGKACGAIPALLRPMHTTPVPGNEQAFTSSQRQILHPIGKVFGHSCFREHLQIGDALSHGHA